MSLFLCCWTETQPLHTTVARNGGGVSLLQPTNYVSDWTNRKWKTWNSQSAFKTCSFTSHAEFFCANVKQPCTRNEILATACLDSAATSICGKTMHWTLFWHVKDHQIPGNDVLKLCNSVRMLIVSDVSMLSATDTKRIDRHLQLLQHDTSRVCGGLDVVFVGNFHQLPPVGRKPTCVTNCPQFASSMNCFLNLQCPC